MREKHRAWLRSAMVTGSSARWRVLLVFCRSGCGRGCRGHFGGCFGGRCRLGVGGDEFGGGGEDGGGGAGEYLIEVTCEGDEVGDGGDVIVVEIAGGPHTGLIEFGGEGNEVGDGNIVIQIEIADDGGTDKNIPAAD